MTQLLTEDDVIVATSGLTRDRLFAFIAAEVVIPLHTDTGQRFRHIDIARLRLLCELSDDLDLDDAALGVVMSLIDQLHDARFVLRTIARALAQEPEDLRARIQAAISPPRA